LTYPGSPLMRTAFQAVQPFCGEGAAFSVSDSGMSDEADLSAEQPRAGAPSRLPCADGDGGRPVGNPGTPCARPQEAVGLTTLTKRRDFLAANAGKRAPMPGFVLLMRPRDDGDPAMRVGFTVTKKIGNAVVRNRMKRRLRALARELLPAEGRPGADHVLIGREGGIERDYAALRAELSKALRKVQRA
jgi:ribonuclease P protein component